jgi:sugar phosphate isomerase/epimerase
MKTELQDRLGISITDRRSLLSGLGAVTTLALAGEAAARPKSPFFARRNQAIGFQLGSLGNVPGRDIEPTFARLAQIGYREIELASLPGLPPAQIGAAATRAGLAISSLHLPLMAMGGAGALSMLSEAARIADTLGSLGARWAVAPILLIPAGFRPQPGEGLEAAISRTVAAAGADIWKQTADLLNKKGEELRKAGIGVAYHNHNLDFAPIGKTTGWDILWHETQADLVAYELDIGWVQLAGIDPVRFLDKVRGRVKLLHVRDMSDRQTRGYRVAMGSPTVGTGLLDWERILPAAYRAGARHFLVEQEPAGTVPMDAAENAFSFLSRLKA